MPWFDTHCHLDALKDLDQELNEARDADITRFLLPAVIPGNWDTCIRIAQNTPNVYLALGIHPQAVRELSDSEIEDALARLPALLQKHNAKAVGEIGIDHRWDKDPSQRTRQKDTFIAQLDIAADLGLPPVIHCLDAQGELLEIWKNHRCHRIVPGILHSYSGSADMVPLYVKLNCYISFSGAVTWSHAKRVPAACIVTPDDRLLVETDAPYQPPHPLKEGPNRLVRLARIGEVVASLRGQHVEYVQSLTTSNACRLLKV